ncbi:hypothetical protein ACFX19_044153 [Malus domestica]
MISERRGVGIGGEFGIGIGGGNHSFGNCRVIEGQFLGLEWEAFELIFIPIHEAGEGRLDIPSFVEFWDQVNDEQKTGIRKTKHDLQVAEEEMVKEKFGISSIFEDLTETYIVTYWNELGRPAFNLGIEKALKMKARGEGWARIIVERIRTNWIPMLKKQSLEFKAYLEPNI